MVRKRLAEVTSQCTTCKKARTNDASQDIYDNYGCFTERKIENVGALPAGYASLERGRPEASTQQIEEVKVSGCANTSPLTVEAGGARRT